MGEIYPVEVWPGGAAVSQLDGATDLATGLPYIAKGTGPTSDPSLEVQYNRAQQRLKRILAPWNQGRVVDEGGGRIGVYPVRYWMDGIMQAFEGATGLAVPAEGLWMVYVDRDGILRVSADWPGPSESFLPLAEVSLSAGVVTITDVRTYAALRAGRDAALWPLALGLQVLAGSEVANAVDVVIQSLDPAGQAKAGTFEVHVWLSDAPAGGVTATAPDGGVTVQTGALLATEAAGKRWRLLTDGAGAAVLRVAHGGVRTWYLRAQIGGRMTGSGEITFA